MKHMKKQTGFTLIELLIVLAIIAMMAALVGPSLMGSFGKGQRTLAAAQVDNLETAVETYRLDVGSYPESLEGLVENDSGRESWDGPYIREIPLDPWDNPYFYQAEGRDFVLMSYGADGVPGGQDDDADISR